METGAIISIAIGIVVSIITWLLNKTDKAQEDKLSAQQEAIRLLFKKHDDDVAALQALQLQIAKEHYLKHELDQRFQQLDATFREGFAGLRSEFKELARILIDHVTKEDAGK
jgi:Tfp pilus assembly protein PilO